MNWLLLPEACKGQSQYTITDTDQINHLLQVVRTKVGDTLRVGILEGNLGHATVTYLSKQGIELTDLTCLIPPPAKLPLTVVMALPRPKAVRRLIMDMTALGVSHIILLNSYRVEKSYWQSPLLSPQSIQTYIDLGLAQAGDTIRPQVQQERRFKPFVQDELPNLLLDRQGVIAHPYATTALSQQMGHQSSATQWVICIGAEGGWIPYEINLMTDIGCHPVTLGRRVLRTETAIATICGMLVGNRSVMS